MGHRNGRDPDMDEIRESISWVKELLKADLPVLYGAVLTKAMLLIFPKCLGWMEFW